MKDALKSVQEIYVKKHSKANAIFWAGSVAKNKNYNARSDLDLVIVYDQLLNPYREAFIYNKWPVDTFVNSKQSLINFFEINRKTGTPGLLSMVADGIEIPISSNYSRALKKIAQDLINNGPVPLAKDDFNSSRFFITDLLDDIIEPSNAHEQLVNVSNLYNLLSKFYLRANNQWAGEGKYLVRRLKEYNPEIETLFYESFNDYFKTNNIEKIVNLVSLILSPYGGELWDGFYLKSS